jgi:hypothetical protein
MVSDTCSPEKPDGEEQGLAGAELPAYGSLAAIFGELGNLCRSWNLAPRAAGTGQAYRNSFKSSGRKPGAGCTY